MYSFYLIVYTYAPICICNSSTISPTLPSVKTLYGTSQALDWLCLAPHPDDAEIGAGGTLIRLARAGKQVGILELTRGEMGTLGTPEEREQECIRAASIMGLSWRGNLGLPDGNLRDDNEASRALAEAIRILKPHTLLVPHHADRHPDHYGAYWLAKRAIHRAGLQKENISGEPWRVSRILLYQGNADITPHFVVDITEHIDTWEAAVLAHASQFTGQAVSETVTPEVTTRRKARLGYWGTLARTRYAEAFQSEGLLSLPPEDLD